MPPSLADAQAAQKVHSKLQIIASGLSGGRSLSQHSQFGFSFSIGSFLPRAVANRARHDPDGDQTYHCKSGGHHGRAANASL